MTNLHPDSIPTPDSTSDADMHAEASTDSDSELLWYACYGSALSYDRFLCYLEGGKAAGATRKNHGARNASEPHDERGYFIPHALYLAQKSLMWGRGGVAFLKPKRDDAHPDTHTWGRCYLITRGQCEDIFRQDNAQPETQLDWEHILAAPATTIGDGWYNHILNLGTLEERPVVTFTSAQIHNVNSPSDAYMQMLIDGLHDCYALGKEGVKGYLRNIPGIKGGKYSHRIIEKMWEQSLENNGASNNQMPDDSIEQTHADDADIITSIPEQDSETHA